MYIPNEASNNKITFISNKPPTRDYFNTIQLDYLIDDFVNEKGNEEVIAYLKNKIKELK